MSDDVPEWVPTPGWLGPEELPEREPLPRWLAPVPKPIEDLGLRLAWLVVAINLVGTAFGLWFYAFRTGQLLETPLPMWPFVPDSPLATLFAAGAFAAFALGRSQEWLNALAFFGNIVLGLWTPYVLLVFDWQQDPLMWTAMFTSHLAMVVQAFVIYRFSDFPVWAVGVAFVWYTADLIVDYHVPILPGAEVYHYTYLPVSWGEPMWGGAIALGVAAAGATVLTLLATFLALSIRVKQLEAERTAVSERTSDASVIDRP